MINPKLNLHHIRTAFIASHLASRVDLSPALQRKTVLAALVHDIGGLNEKSRLEPLNYIDDERNNHALIGSELLSRIPLFRPLNKIVRYHHTHWRNGLGHYIEGELVPEESHLLFFADRLDVLYSQHRATHIAFLGKKLLEIVNAGAHILYKEEYIQAFRTLSENKHFWTVMASSDYRDYIKEIPGIHNDTISLHNLRDIAKLLSFIIDQFAEQTPCYSAAVGRIAGYLATKMGMSAAQTLKVEIGGLLHNISCLDHSPPLQRLSTAKKSKQPLYLIEGIDDISEWMIMQNSLNPYQLSNPCLEPEAALIAIGRQIVQVFTSTRTGEKSLAQIINHHRGDKMHQFIMSLVAQYSSQIMQIYQTTDKEIAGLVERISQLTDADR
nr:HD domain-containing protein [uncultured Klebsiella sp.]